MIATVPNERKMKSVEANLSHEDITSGVKLHIEMGIKELKVKI
jgi:hypothetical protein